MIRIRETIDLRVSADDIWSILHDPAAVARCIPGAELKAEIGPGLYEASMSIKFGPTVAQFAGEARLEYDEIARRLTVSGRGFDRKGSSPATGSGVITIAGDTTAKLAIDGSVEVSGPLEFFVETGGVFVARALLAQFAENLGNFIQTERSGRNDTAGQPTTRATPAPVVPLSTGRLLRDIVAERARALWNWLFRRRQ